MELSELMKQDVSYLTALYDKEFQELKKALINGKQWQDVREQRYRVTQLAITIHKKLARNDNSDPSANPTR